jgi:hypothetical protein
LQAVKKLRGKVGTQVTVTILREGEEKLLEFTITRDLIKIQSIKEARFLEEGIGYIRLAEFQENTPRDFEKALKDLEKKQLKGLVLDIRNNPGGLLNTAVEVAESFVPKGEMVVYTKGRLKEQDIDASEDELLIRRIVSRSGRNKIYVNGTLVPAAVLQQITMGLVDITGQHEHVWLIQPETQLDLVDMFAGAQALKTEVQAQFGHLLEAFQYGAPPHGGIALGIDRLSALFAESSSIREVIAFPKTAAGTDLMVDAPSPVTEAQLEELHIALRQGRK